MEQQRLNNELTKLDENINLLIKTQEELDSSLFQCCISQTYTDEPYLCGCGCGSLFDKSTILQWLSRKKTCPISRRCLTFENLTLDRMRKNKIEELQDKINNLKNLIDTNKSNIQRYKNIIESLKIPDIDFISYNTLSENGYDYYQITTNETEAIKQTIYFLVDTSYSMSATINIKNSEINCQLSFLELVKHSLGVFCKLLENNSNVEICIIKFSDNSDVICDPQHITSANIDSINTKIGNLIPDGQTNIYSAFLKAFTYIKESNTYSNIVLLTDGVPTPHYTPNGLDKHIFKSLLKNNLTEQISINTIGLGYNLEIKSLISLSKQTNGSYFYMPESSLVGPTIIHLLINLTTKCCKSVNLELTYENNTYFNEITKNLDLFHYEIVNDNKLIINMGSINISQKLVVKINNIIKPIDTKIIVSTNNNAFDVKLNNKINIDTDYNNLRLDTTYKLNNIYNKLLNSINGYNCNNAKDELDILISEINNMDYVNSYLDDFLKDITDQIYKGLTKLEYFNRWGKFYIPSIIHFHNKKICPNFIQPGLQHYKNDKMIELAEDYHEIFCTYEPPKLNYKPVQYRHPSQYNNYTQSSNRTQNSNNYRSSTSPITNNNSNTNSNLYRTISSAGCFHGDSLVKIANNNCIKIKDLRKNTHIIDSDGNPAIIECVVTFPCNNSACLSEFSDGLKITPYHPIKINGTWRFPIDVVGAENADCTKLYNFVLNTRKSIIVNNIVCCTLGHNLQGPVIGHDFFGTDNVVNNLKRKFSTKYDKGLVDNITNIIRSPINNNIIGYDHIM